LSDPDKVLISLAVEPNSPKQIRDIKALASKAGWRAAQKKNVSAILARMSTFAVRTSDGWELTSAGSQHIARIAGALMSSPIPKVASSLRAQLVKIAKPDTQAFVEEAIVCFVSFRQSCVIWADAYFLLAGLTLRNSLSHL
jgi:hypothetical protein